MKNEIKNKMIDTRGQRESSEQQRLAGQLLVTPKQGVAKRTKRKQPGELGPGKTSLKT